MICINYNFIINTFYLFVNIVLFLVENMFISKYNSKRLFIDKNILIIGGINAKQ